MTQRLNVLVLYHSTQTFTNTVFEHLDSFARYSDHRFFYCHHDDSQPFNVDLDRFDVVVIHYCLRLPYNQVSETAAQRLAAFDGPKAVFIQDEYDHTGRAWYWIKRLGVHLVFTVVPEPHIEQVYPTAEFPAVRFVNNLTGYVPEEVLRYSDLPPPSARSLLVGYRGRPLPIRYGQLGQEKVGIGRMVKAYCEARGLRHDIAWSEEARIYGPAWYEFMGSCRAMLGSESGSNVFDWDGALQAELDRYVESHPGADEQELYANVVASREVPGLMNQISPRAFEAISLRTAMVLFEGNYSGVLRPWDHYLPLKKDGSNLDEVFACIQDREGVDAMVNRAWQDIIGSGRYSYTAFVRFVDHELQSLMERVSPPLRLEPRLLRDDEFNRAPDPITASPTRWQAPGPMSLSRKLVLGVWRRLPARVKSAIRVFLGWRPAN